MVWLTLEWWLSIDQVTVSIWHWVSFWHLVDVSWHSHTNETVGDSVDIFDVFVFNNGGGGDSFSLNNFLSFNFLGVGGEWEVRSSNVFRLSSLNCFFVDVGFTVTSWVGFR